MPEETFEQKGCGKSTRCLQGVEKQGLTKAIPLVVCKDKECDGNTRSGCMHSIPHAKTRFCGYYAGCNPCEEVGIDLTTKPD